MADFELTGKPRRSTVFTAEFPTIATFKIKPTRATLHQEQYVHDILTLEYDGVSKASVETINTGIPVKFIWTQGNRRKLWYGYVAYVSKETAAQKNKPITIRCVGSSFVLKKRTNTVYKDKTIPEVAALIAKEHGLKFVGENHQRRFSQLSLAGKSQWEWLHENAARIGFAMFIDETSLVFKPIDSLLDEFTADVPLFQFWSEALPRTEYVLDRTLDSFSVLKGEYIEDGSETRTTKTVAGVDPVTGISFSESTSPDETGAPIRTQLSDVLFDGFKTEEVAENRLAAKLASKGAAELARFNLPAKAVGQGDPRVFPYKLIYVDGIDKEFNGHWLVREVTHMFRFGGDYIATFSLASDGVKENVRTNRRRNSRTSVSQQRRTLNRKGVGTIDTSRLLAGNNSFELSPSFVGGVDLAVATSTAPRFGRPKETTALVSKRPVLTDVNNQGFKRTPTLWRSSSPSSSSISSANLGRKCS